MFFGFGGGITKRLVRRDVLVEAERLEGDVELGLCVGECELSTRGKIREPRDIITIISQTHKHLKNAWVRRSASERRRRRTHVIEIELVLGKPDDVIADLLILCKRLGRQPFDVFDGVLPARRGLRGCQGCHRGSICGEPEVEIGVGERRGVSCRRGGGDVSVSRSTL